jgi:hypothetical protein
MIILEPGFPADAFCSCPHCGLIALHAMEEARRMIRDTAGRPTPTTIHDGWRRTCVFCHREWITKDQS